MLLKTNDPILKQVSEPFDFEAEDAEELFTKMRDVMCENKGIGLSAIQIGIPKRVFIAGDPDYPERVIPFFHPKIVDTFGEDVYYEEGCVPFPGLWVRVKRLSGVRLRFTKLDGDTETMKFDGLTARIILHEYDHLDGTLYTARANRFHLDQAKKNLKKINRLRKKNAAR